MFRTRQQALKHQPRHTSRTSLNLLNSPFMGRKTQRSITLPKENINKILLKLDNSPDPLIKRTEKTKPLAPLYLQKMPPFSRSLKLFPTTIKSRFKDLKISQKVIPQNDHLIFLLDKVPTFEIVREKNIAKNKKILKSVKPIVEDQNEYNIE